jgi:hypothetical protein
MFAFVNVFVESSEMDNVVTALDELESLEELYEVTGEFDIVSLVSATDIEEFRDVLKNKIMKIKGVKSTITNIMPIKNGVKINHIVGVGAIVSTNVFWSFEINDRCSSSAISHPNTWSNHTLSLANSTLYYWSL